MTDTLPTALRLIRVFHDLSQTALAQKLNISRAYVSEIEHGNKLPSLKIIQQYAKVFGLTTSWILLFSEELEKKESIISYNRKAAEKGKNLLAWATVASLTEKKEDSK
jgi:transcriptional regulator with XRE-family HTH domain